MINILNDAEIRMIWPHESIFHGSSFIKHPNTQVLVERDKKECVAVYGESFSWGDNMDSPLGDAEKISRWSSKEAANKSRLITDDFTKSQLDMNKFLKLNHWVEKPDSIFQFVESDEHGNALFNTRNDNFSFRMNNNLGGYLTRKLDTDYWFSCVPGQGTATTLYGLENSIKSLSSNYDKVYVIFQMTDPARDFGMGDKDTTIYRFTEEPHQMKLTNLTDNEMKYDVDEFFLLYEQIYADRLKELKKEYPNCEFIVWKNFTRWCGADFGTTITIKDIMFEHYWKLSNKDGECPVPILGPNWWDDFQRDIKSVSKIDIEYVMKELELGKKSWEWMVSDENIYEGDRWGVTGYHPSPLGHKVWANYILQHIEEHNGKD